MQDFLFAFLVLLGYSSLSKVLHNLFAFQIQYFYFIDLLGKYLLSTSYATNIALDLELISEPN
jgi:hypothetical protein